MVSIAEASPIDYVRALDLPDAGPVFERVRPQILSTGREAVAIGSELTEFTDAVPADVRAAIADSILLAQLAANKAAGDARDVFLWYDKYAEVLQSIGWQMRDVDFQTHKVGDANAGVHKELVPVLAAMLGPQAAAASIVLAALNGLQEMDAGSPWITVFDRASQHTHGAKFQVGYVDADEHGDPAITLLALGIRADQTITQVLFFKFKTRQVELRKAGGRMAVSMARLNAAKDLIAERVDPFVQDFVAKLDI